MSNLQRRYEQVKAQLEEQQTLKIKLQTNLETMKERISKDKQELEEQGITYDTLDDLETVKAELEGRVDRILTHLEQELN